MAKLTAVEIWGFQSHVETQYELHPGLNVFTGPTDGGKTSGTIRALRWLAKGEPSGEEFLYTIRDASGDIAKQAGEAGVTVKLDNGMTITKTRRKGKTKYFVTGYDDPFEKAEVPEAVKKALGIESMIYSRDTSGKPDLEYDLHFAYQLAAPFLISDPGSAGAKVLGKLAGTEAVDGAIKSVAKDTYSARQAKADADKEYERKIAQLLDYLDVDDLQNQINACEFLFQEVESQLERKEDLIAQRMALDAVMRTLSATAQKLDQLAIVPQLEEDLKDIEKAQQRYDTLLDLYNQFGKATATVDRLSEELKQYAGLEAAEYRTAQADSICSKRKTLSDLFALYTKTVQSVNTAQITIDQAKGLAPAAEHIAFAGIVQQQLEDILAQAAVYSIAAQRENRAQVILENLAGIQEAGERTTIAEFDYNRQIQLYEKRRNLTVKSSTLDRASTAYQTATLDIEVAESELATAWNEAGGVCPLCEQPLSVITGGHTHGS